MPTPRAVRRWWIAALVLALSGLAAPAAAQGDAALEVLIREAGSGRPLGEATVRVVDLDRTARTDATGHALLQGVPAGLHAVELTYPGYAPRTLEARFEPGRVTQVQAVLDVRAIELEGVSVTAEARNALLGRVGFYERQSVYGGDFVGPREMDAARTRATPLSDVMRGRVGVSVVPSQRGGYRLISTRSITPGGCPVAIFIDGVRQHGVEDLDRLLPLTEVGALEIYPGKIGTPLVFQSPAHCGAMVIWTRNGR